MGGFVCGCGAAALIVLVAALVLQRSVSMTNRMTGAVPVPEVVAPRTGGIAEWDWDDWDDWDDEYEAEPPPRVRGRGRAIPEPGLIKSGFIVFLTAFAATLGFILLGFAAESQGLRMRRDETRLAVGIVDLPIAFLTLSAALTALLPTSFWRAAMVAFLFGFILLMLTLGIGALVFVIQTVT